VGGEEARAGTVVVKLSSHGRGSEGVLAETVLRLQRIQRWEITRETGVHARESGDQKLVEHPKDWPWSSWSFYAKEEIGLIRIDPVKN